MEKRTTRAYDAVVIGAGNGGLTAAIRILQGGFSCLVLEKHNLPGGFATSFRRGRFEFEASLHELNDFGSAQEPGEIRELFRSLGVEDKIEWLRIPEAYHLITTDKQYDCVMPFGVQAFIDRMEEYVPGSRKSMLLFYGARTEAQLAFRAELDALTEKGLRVVYVLSDETKAGFEHGFVTAELLEKYVDIRTSSFFLCGPQAMYDFLDAQLAPYGLPRKAVHRDASCCPNLRLEAPRVFRLTVHVRDQIFSMEAAEHETLLTAMERAGVPAPNRCRAGGCGYCHSKWLSGEFRIAEGRDGRREADRKFGWIHPCVTYPMSDMELEVPAEK